VNTVNTVGVMGKGIALQFKRAYPDMFKAYARAAKAEEIRIGRMHLWTTGQLDGPRLIINFPTKRHWRAGSKLADIEAGLTDLVRVIQEEHIESIAIPPLGCGHGGLKWSEVEPLMRRSLDQVDGVDVHIYAPVGAPSATDMRSAGPKPRMTHARAMLIAIVRRYSAVALEGATPIATQKLMYFTQAAGEDLGLRFAKCWYGPYADNLRAMLRDVEGHYLEGFGDGSTRAEFREPFRLLTGAHEEAMEVLRRCDGSLERIERVMELTVGYESSNALELLATVHWIAHQPGMRNRSGVVVADAVRQWSSRKERLFTTGQVEKALAVLLERGWLKDGATPE